jgi:hypothetical protein
MNNLGNHALSPCGINNVKVNGVHGHTKKVLDRQEEAPIFLSGNGDCDSSVDEGVQSVGSSNTSAVRSSRARTRKSMWTVGGECGDNSFTLDNLGAMSDVSSLEGENDDEADDPTDDRPSRAEVKLSEVFSKTYISRDGDDKKEDEEDAQSDVSYLEVKDDDYDIDFLGSCVSAPFDGTKQKGVRIEAVTSPRPRLSHGLRMDSMISMYSEYTEVSVLDDEYEIIEEEVMEDEEVIEEEIEEEVVEE